MRLVLGAAFVMALPGVAQNLPSGAPQANNGQYTARAATQLGNFDNDDPVVAEKRLQAVNADRQKHMVSDAAKLLKLAGELNAEVSQGKADSLTLAELRKLAEIEKLARSVKEKMTYTVGDLPSARVGPRPWSR